MTDCLIYWKDYWSDVGAEPNAVDYHWYDSRGHLFNYLDSNSSLWIVVSGGVEYPEEWRLLERIAVRAWRFEDKYNYRGGRPYHVIGSNKKSRQFDLDAQPDFTPILHELEFITGKRIVLAGTTIGLALQQIRPLTSSDSRLLERYINYLDKLSSSMILEEHEVESELKVGAGFGSPESNRQIEHAARNIVIQWYRAHGWRIKSVEAEKCGYDLLCTKGSSEEHVEVKGIKGRLPAFIITANEVKQAQVNSSFRICLVTSALSNSPNMHYFTGEELLANFDLTPLAFRARFRSSSPFAVPSHAFNSTIR